MQLLLSFNTDFPFSVPMNYNYQFQSAIFSKLSEIGASEFWHKVGYGSTKIFKAFTFGRLEGRHYIEGKNIVFTDVVNVEIRSPIFEFCDNLQRAFELSPFIKLFDREFSICALQAENRHINSEKILVATASPIVVRKTLCDGHSVFYGPQDEEYVEMLTDNFINKYSAVFGQNPGKINIEIVEKGSKCITQYKNMWIIGYNCKMIVESEIRLLDFIYNAGLGEKNSQGFGMLKLLKEY